MANYVDPRIDAIDNALIHFLGSEQEARMWWIRGNLAFNDKTPAEVFEKDPSRVAQYIIDLFTVK